MRKLSTLERKGMAVDRLINTTKSIQQIALESSMSWMAISRLARELQAVDSSILDHRAEYNPVELRTDLGPDTSLNMKAWHIETSKQMYRRGPRLADARPSRTRSQMNIEAIIARYSRNSG